MHNIRKKEIQDLANHLSQAVSTENTGELLKITRDLYERIVVFDFENTNKKEVIQKDEAIDTVEVVETVTAIKEEVSKQEPIQNIEELSVQERIKMIMATAPKLKSTDIKVADIKPKVDTTVKKEFIESIEKPISTSNPIKEVPKITFENVTKKSENIFTEKSKDSFFTSKKEIKKPDASQQESLLKSSLEKEFEDAISADLAADLFEKAEKRPLTKKSLNERLSQSQIQIGLNDRIAFVKHLFNGSQPDFNRVLSQLNSFSSEEQANSFISNTVIPEYKWSEDSEYVERLLALVARRF